MFPHTIKDCCLFKKKSKKNTSKKKNVFIDQVEKRTKVIISQITYKKLGLGRLDS